MPTLDAIRLLKKDHRTVNELLAGLAKAPDANRRLSLLDQVETELKIHSTIKEEIFYPAFKRAVDSKADRLTYFAAHEAHDLIDHVLFQMHEVDPSSEHFAAKARVFKDLVEHHTEMEENEMFDVVRKRIPQARLMELGRELQDRKRQLAGAIETEASHSAPASRRPRARSSGRSRGRSAPRLGVRN
jgi:hemerythrin-like domain-containing protein